MAIPTWTVGQVLSASDVNTYFVPLSARKSADESVTSSATLQNDNDLALSLSSTTGGWWLEGILLLDAGQTGDFKADWTGPAGGVINLAWHGDSTGNTGASNDTQVAYQSAFSDLVTFGGFAVGGGTVRPVIFEGTVRTTGTSDTLQLRWAQNTSNSTATILKTNSQIWARRIE